ncbi:MAG: helix-turn-helix transcriptional regulator, partial [Anaerovoracaceae bacterium]
IFLYMTVDFTAFYFIKEKVSESLTFALIICSELLFFALILAWLNLINAILEEKTRVNIKWVTIGTIVYVAIVEPITAITGSYGDYTIITGEGSMQIVLSVLNGIFDLVIILISAYLFFYAFTKKEKGVQRTAVLIISSLLVGYMIWVAFWDYAAVFEGKDNLLLNYPMDPLILIYILLNVTVVYRFYKKEVMQQVTHPSGEDVVGSKEAALSFAKVCGLSNREIDVLLLINEGKSNPQIAEELFIAENTVKRHISNIFKKTESSSRYELLAKIKA